MIFPALHPSTAMAEVLVDELIRCGVTDAVLAPGSRSAPLALAVHAAECAGRLRLHVRIDERSAAFLALGLARASGRTVPVICTSGTAAANCHPAVIEADASCLPLLLLTADRPPDLRGIGAPQTIDQMKLYGGAVRWFCDEGVPERRPGSVQHWRSLTARAHGHTLGALHSPPGPVHLNIAFREPLVSSPDDQPPEPWPESLDGRPGAEPWCRFSPPAVSGGGLLPSTERGVLLLGDGCGDPAPLIAHAQQAGWPVLAEPTSGGRYGSNALSAYPHVLSVPGFLQAHRPDLVVSAGRPGLTRQQTALLRTAETHAVVAGPLAADPARTAQFYASPSASMRTHDAPAVASGWLSSWLDADRAVRHALDTTLDGCLDITAPGVVRALARHLPESGLLFTGPSLSVRDLDQQLPVSAAAGGPRILANRGASGIDGVVSSAIGAALAHDGPAYGLLGDLTLLHDQNGLFFGSGEQLPDLALVVVNNDGGGIFSLLEQAAHPRSFERVFATPHGADLCTLAATMGIPYTRLRSLEELPGVLEGKGLRLIEARTDRTEDRALRFTLHKAARGALPPAWT